MQRMKFRDLKHRLQLMRYEQKPTPTGGFREIWTDGPATWSLVKPVSSPGGYSSRDPHGGISAGQGSLAMLPPSLYQVIIPLSCDLYKVRRFIWHDYKSMHTLEIIHRPQYTHCHRFQSILTMEVPDVPPELTDLPHK